ncbi:hypothetical protein AALP_AA2G165500 [Arabis alpina]|uniref:DUF1204 domain-containing protein n=1 Tax=Arabis alpina TaxID=50452 RepID=A0A087HHY1_ARAAL|nr:hypothetical protein AALP_AA2G165500 [Arabis alpina]
MSSLFRTKDPTLLERGTDPIPCFNSTDDATGLDEPNTDDNAQTTEDPACSRRRTEDPSLNMVTRSSGSVFVEMLVVGSEAPRLRNTPMRSSGDEDPMRGDAANVLTQGTCDKDVFGLGGTILLNDEDPNLPLGHAEASSSSSSSDSRASSDESDDEDTFIEVEQTKRTKKVKRKAKAKVRPDPPRSSLSNEKSLTHIRKKCEISEEIMLVAHTPADRADSPPLGYMTLFENYFGQRLLWFPLSHFLMRFLAVNGVCLAQINPKGIRHLLEKPSLPGVSKEFLAAMHKELSSGNGNWRKSFSRKRIERAFSAEILPRKILGLGQARVSFREQAALEAAMKRVDAFPAAAVGGEASASRVGGLLRDEAYSVVKSRYSERSLLFDRLVGDYDEDVRTRGSELSAAKEANAALQSRLDETIERNEALESDALALQKVKKDYDDKLAKLKLRCTKAEGEAVQLRGELSSASDLQRSRIDDAVAEARDEMTRSFAEQTSEVDGLLAEIGGKAQNDILNLTEIDANLEFIGLLHGSEPPDLLTEVKALCGRRHPIYDAHDVFADLFASVQRVLEIPVVSAGAAEASVAVDDDGVR